VDETEQGPLRRFIRDTLGCGCPDEVLAAIRCEALAGQASPSRRLDVGGRLLVWVVSADLPTAADLVARCVPAGRDERDRLGFNRFRLVVTSGDPAVARAAKAAFASSAAVDERTHLHVVPPEVVPAPARG